jgi:uncharacterized metal-binding protein
MADCTDCKQCACYQGNDCTHQIETGNVIPFSVQELNNDENLRLMKVSSELEAEFYMKYTRIEELIEFSRRMNYKHIGIAHCVGLVSEVKILKKILEKDFTLTPICCKFSGVDKKEYNVPQIRENRYEAICNPIAQAEFLNEKNTDLNIIAGLCVGHDILFTKYSKAPVTTLIVKDRVLGHNPVAALYSTYYHRKFGI